MNPGVLPQYRVTVWFSSGTRVRSPLFSSEQAALEFARNEIRPTVRGIIITPVIEE
jgi:hypothetical protein